MYVTIQVKTGLKDNLMNSYTVHGSDPFRSARYP